MGMAVSDVFVVLILALCLGFYFCWVVCFVFLHEGLKNILECIGGDSSIDVGGRRGRCCRRWKIGVLIFVVSWFLLVERHMVYDLL